MSALYRKYRPQTFKDLIGQNHIKITLQNEIELGEIGHAYLFCGPRGLGKTTSARLFAKAINCENRKEGESEPCNECSSCLDVINSSSVDTIEIDAASHTGVDNVRENIIENARFTPTKSKYKVFIIDEVHMLSTAAFNALLKTLEEPPAHVIFILCTTETHKLPQTIISRCQRFDFKKVSMAEMLDLLKLVVKSEGKKVTEDVLKNIVTHSEGCVRDAESLLGKILTLGDDIDMDSAELVLPRTDFKSITDFLSFLGEKNPTAAIELINKLVEDGVDLQVFADGLIEFLRKILLLKVNYNLNDFGIELDEDSQKSAEKLAEVFTYEKLISIIELFMEKAQELKSATIVQFPLEMAVIQFDKNVVCENRDINPASTGRGVVMREDAKCAEPTPPKEVFDKAKEKIQNLNRIQEAEKIEKTKVEEVAEELKKEDEIMEEVSEIKMSDDENKQKTKTPIDLNKVKENWVQISEKLFEKNFTLSSLLRISQPLSAKDNVLEIAVKSQFYKDRLECASNRKVVEDVISEAISAPVSIRGVVQEDLVIPELKEKVDRPVFGADPAMFKSKAEADVVVTKPSVPTDVVADVIGMF
ncbi:MAG: DNA polymerase III subunit gamma/tau [Patescibacteria group bacterium]|jgi:DNA polymerase-3 subunit gamma/tau